MPNLKLVFVCLIAISAVSAEFLFEKNVAADDKFMCLHKKLYRREKPAVKSNPARILSMMRNLQSLYPAGMDAQYQTDFNGMAAYLSEAGRFSFIVTSRTASAYATALYKREFIAFFVSDDFKQMVSDAVTYTYSSFRDSNTLASNPIGSANFVNAMADNTKSRIDQMMTGYLMQYNIDQALADGISYNKIVYLMLNILPLFKEDIKTARTAYEDYYSSNKDQILGNDAINSAAVVRWIESIKTRYVQLRAAPTPDTEIILEPYFTTGYIVPEIPSGNILEPLPNNQNPSPSEIEEPEPTPTYKTVNEDLLIPDMIIEIQRTYNVYKMLLAYSQLPQAMKDDIDSCKLNLAPALARCESIFGSGNCEPVSGTMINQKCPSGYLRQGCCKCVIECSSDEFYTANRAFCQMKEELHNIPVIQTSSSASSSSVVNSGMNIALGACKKGFSLNKFVCYKNCPTGTRAVGGATCLKDQPIALGSPFSWTGGDE